MQQQMPGAPGYPPAPLQHPASAGGIPGVPLSVVQQQLASFVRQQQLRQQMGAGAGSGSAAALAAMAAAAGSRGGSFAGVPGLLQQQQQQQQHNHNSSSSSSFHRPQTQAGPHCGAHDSIVKQNYHAEQLHPGTLPC
jgi:hypothetical protein